MWGRRRRVGLPGCKVGEVIPFSFFIQFKDKVVTILNFTALLIEHSYARHIYNSIEVSDHPSLSLSSLPPSPSSPPSLSSLPSPPSLLPPPKYNGCHMVFCLNMFTFQFLGNSFTIKYQECPRNTHLASQPYPVL